MFPSGVTEFVLGFFEGDRPSSGGGGGGQEEGIAMKGAQSKVKWGEGQMGNPWCEWGPCHHPYRRSYATDDPPHTPRMVSNTKFHSLLIRFIMTIEGKYKTS